MTITLALAASLAIKTHHCDCGLLNLNAWWDQIHCGHVRDSCQQFTSFFDEWWEPFILLWCGKVWNQTSCGVWTGIPKLCCGRRSEGLDMATPPNVAGLNSVGRYDYLSSQALMNIHRYPWISIWIRLDLEWTWSPLDLVIKKHKKTQPCGGAMAMDSWNLLTARRCKGWTALTWWPHEHSLIKQQRRVKNMALGKAQEHPKFGGNAQWNRNRHERSNLHEVAAILMFI